MKFAKGVCDDPKMFDIENGPRSGVGPFKSKFGFPVFWRFWLSVIVFLLTILLFGEEKNYPDYSYSYYS